MDLHAVNAFLNPKGYSVEITGDGSPTLRWGVGESMHHSGGAASESIYIYQTALSFLNSQDRQLLRQQKTISEEELQSFTLGVKEKISIMSLGFGLGYNELLIAEWVNKNSFQDNQIKIYSYEKEEFLYQAFNLWINEEQGVLNPIFDLILVKLFGYDANIGSSAGNLKKTLRKMRNQQFWIQEKALVPPLKSKEKFSVFLFDAFSNKTTPELWQNDFLDELLQNNVSSPCVFSTYACRGELKRVLQKNDFQFLKRPGFKGKRDATLAFKI